MRRVVLEHADLVHRIDELEERYDGAFADIFAALRRLIAEKKPKPAIGFR
jgi:hypothetical protein